MRFRAAIAMGLTTALFVASSAAAAGQLDPRTPPQRSDNLKEAYAGCSDSPVRSEKGKFLGTVTNCIYLYWLDALQEIDPTRDYGVFWVQTRFKPIKGLCLTGIGARASLPSTVEGHAYAPHRMSTTRKRTVTPRLNVTAEGNAVAEGWIKQSLVLNPRRLTSALKSKGRRLDVVWSGDAKDSVSMAFGLEFSVETLENTLVGIEDLEGGMMSISGYLHRRC